MFLSIVVIEKIWARPYETIEDVTSPELARSQVELHIQERINIMRNTIINVLCERNV